MLQRNIVKRRIQNLFSSKGSFLLCLLAGILIFDSLQMIILPLWTGFPASLCAILFGSVTAAGFFAWQRRRNKLFNKKQMLKTQKPSEIPERDQAQYFQKILDADPSLIYVKDRQGHYRYCNSALATVWGTKPSEIIGKTDPEVLPGGEWYALTSKNNDAVLHAETEEITAEEQIVDSEGNARWYQVTRRRIVLDNHQDADVVSIARDICQLKMYEDRLLYERLHDPLTGLPNLESFKVFLEEKNQREKQPNVLSALLLLDVDQFRRINESHGYSFGDQLMIAVSRRLASCIRASDIIIRLKGDEFALLINELNDHDEVNLVIQRIFEKLLQPFVINENEYLLTISIGIVFGNGVPKSADDMLRDAEIAVNLAKVRGKSNHVVFNENMRADLASMVNLETDLRKAIQQKQLKLHYQPIISHITGKVQIVEALVRWEHPKRGLIYPNDFIQLAEESELIIPLGEWVLREACRQTHSWQTQYPDHQPLMVSVNISCKQLLHPGFVNQVLEILRETGLDAHHLKMEITESIFLGKSEEVIQVLTRLNETGVQLYIDDFGTGYSSLSYLSQIPFDAIKIDRSFIDGVINRDGDMKIVEAIVRLAFDLGKDLVAEGVETLEQRAWLQKLGCKYEQGYLFSRPVKAAEMGKFFLSP